MDIYLKTFIQHVKANNKVLIKRDDSFPDILFSLHVIIAVWNVDGIKFKIIDKYYDNIFCNRPRRRSGGGHSRPRVVSSTAGC